MFFCMQKTAYELRISDWSSDVCSSDLADREHAHAPREIRPRKPESDVENQARIEPRFRRAEQEAQDVEHLGRSGEGEPQRLHADDTPVPVLAPGMGKTKTGRLWVYVRDERPHGGRSEEHTSELQSLMRISYAAFCLNKKTDHINKNGTIKKT